MKRTTLIILVSILIQCDPPPSTGKPSPDEMVGWYNYPNVHSVAMANDRNGDLWMVGLVGQASGVFKYTGETWSKISPDTLGLDSGAVTSIWCSDNGLTYVGKKATGFVVFDCAHWTTLTRQNGLVNDSVIVIKTDPNNRVWIGTRGGLSMYDGTGWINYTTANGLPNNHILDIAFDTDQAPIVVSIQGSRIDVVYWKNQTGPDGYVWYVGSANYGQSWSMPARLTPLVSDKPAIAAGRIARYVPTTTQSDIWFTVKDDSLLSDVAAATAYNWGRHMVRDPWSGSGNGRLHAVYFSQGRPHHSYSDDNGTSWSPYYIIEKIAPAPPPKDSGSYPTVGLVPGPVFNYYPCVVYLNRENKVEYRYQDFNGVWQGFAVRGNTNGTNGEPSVAAVGDGRVYVMIPVRWSVSPKQSAIKFYDFYYTGGTMDSVQLDLIGNTTALGDPCITVDGNYDLHCVWRRSGDIKYARRISGIWDTLNYRFRATTPYSKTPFIECYGDRIAAPFVDSFAANNTEIMWTARDLPNYPWTPTSPQNISLSSAIRSDYPSSASCDFTVWSEQRTTPSGNYDTKWYWHPHVQYGWACETSPKSYFSHSLQYYDWLPGHYDLITVRTEGNAVPYRIAATHQELLPPPGGDQIYYRVETGKDDPSFFCTKRDGFIRYARYDVDYGTSELEYTLTLLNPLYPAYRVKILSYFEGSGNRAEKVIIDGQEHTTLELKPNELIVSTILVTREYYKDDHKAVVAFHGAGAVKAGLVVYQLEKLTSGGYSGGGSQNAEVSSVERNFQLSISPNPVYGRAVVSYVIPVTSRVSLKLFDGAGRLIRVLDKGIRASGVHRFDIPTEKLAQGVYFVRLETTNETKVEKLIIVK